jgi:hypothetical protein
MKVSETKRLTVNYPKIELYHNVLSLSQMLALNGSSVMPAINVTQNGRIGDRINVLGWSIKMLCGQKGDRPNVNWRWFAVQFPGTIPLTGLNLPYNNVFENITSNVLLDDIQKDTCKVLASGYMRPNQAGLVTGDEYTFCKRMFISHKKLYKFGPNDSVQQHNQNPVYFFCVVYDTTVLARDPAIPPAISDLAMSPGSFPPTSPPAPPIALLLSISAGMRAAKKSPRGSCSGFHYRKEKKLSTLSCAHILG